MIYATFIAKIILLLSMLGSLPLLAAEKPNPKSTAANKSTGKDPFAKYQYQAMIASGIPHPYELGIIKKLKDGRSIGLLGGYIQREFRPGKGFKNIQGTLSHIEGRYQVFPNVGELPFWAVSLGYQDLTVKAAKTVPVSYEGVKVDLNAQAKMQIQALYWSPQFGVASQWRNGGYYQFSLGLQIPFYAQAHFESAFTDDPLIDEAVKSTQSYRDFESDLQRIGTRIGKLALPIIKIFEFGISF